MGTGNTKELPAKHWGLIALALATPVYFVVNHYCGGGDARAAGAFTGIIILIMRIFWYLRSYAWYWLTICALITAHVVLIIAIPWTNEVIPAPAIAPVGIADGLIIYGCIKLVEKVMTQHKADNHNNV